jgi:hypothetical protein
MLEEILEHVLGTLVYPVEVLDREDQGSDRSALEDDPVQSLNRPVFFRLGSQGGIDAAVFDAEQLQQVGLRRRIVGPEDAEPLRDFFADRIFSVVLPDVEVALEDVDRRVVGHAATVREALPLKECHILVHHIFPKLV